MSDRHLTPSEFARREGVPLKTIYQWNSGGGGPKYLKVGRHVRYRLRDILAWEAAREVDHGQRGGDAA